jgi:hypothetical protein
MNQENISLNPTLDLLSQATGITETQNVPTGNPTLDLLNQSTQSSGFEQTQSTWNPTLDLLNQNGIDSNVNESFNQNILVEDNLVQLDNQMQAVSVQTEVQAPIDNPMLQGSAQFIKQTEEVQPPSALEQDLQTIAFSAPVNQPNLVQQSPETLFGGLVESSDTSTEEPAGTEKIFDPFDFTAQ